MLFRSTACTGSSGPLSGTNCSNPGTTDGRGNVLVYASASQYWCTYYGSTITAQYGVLISDQTQGASNYGVASAVSSGTNKWNIYASGTAANYFAGNVGIGTSTIAYDGFARTLTIRSSTQSTLELASDRTTAGTVSAADTVSAGPCAAGTKRTACRRPRAG